MVANRDNIKYGFNNFVILLFKREDSSIKNKQLKNVPRQEINPRKLFFNPKNSKV